MHIKGKYINYYIANCNATHNMIDPHTLALVHCYIPLELVKQAHSIAKGVRCPPC